LRNVGDACNYTVRLLLVRPLLFCSVFLLLDVNKIWRPLISAAVWKEAIVPSGHIGKSPGLDESDGDDNEEDSCEPGL
jgi:hypothetical protein